MTLERTKKLSKESLIYFRKFYMLNNVIFNNGLTIKIVSFLDFEYNRHICAEEEFCHPACFYIITQ